MDEVIHDLAFWSYVKHVALVILVVTAAAVALCYTPY